MKIVGARAQKESDIQLWWIEVRARLVSSDLYSLTSQT